MLYAVGTEPHPAWLDTRGVLADWLEDRSDPRAVPVRAAAVDRHLHARTMKGLMDGERRLWTASNFLSFLKESESKADGVCDRDLRRRILALFPEVVVLTRQYRLGVSDVNNQAEMDRRVDRAWEMLKAEGWSAPPGIGADYDPERRCVVFGQVIHAPFLVPPEPTRNADFGLPGALYGLPVVVTDQLRR